MVLDRAYFHYSSARSSNGDQEDENEEVEEEEDGEDGEEQVDEQQGEEEDNLPSTELENSGMNVHIHTCTRMREHEVH